MKSFVRFKIDTNSIETDVLEQLEKSQKHTLEEASVELEVFTQHTDKNLVLLKNEAINYQVASYDISDLSVAIEELDKQYSVQVKEAEALWSEHYDLCQEKINAPSDLHAEYDEKINAVVKKHREKEAEANETKRQLDILKGKKAIAELNQATIKRQSAVNVATFSSYYKEYLNLDAKLESLRLHTPVNYLRKDGVIKGFNADGDLVVIFDSYGNYHALSYDKRTVGGEKRTYITGIVDQNERQTVFNYNANLQLTSIITPNGDRTEYEYSAEKLSRILYSDGTTLKLITSAKTVTQIKSSEKQYAAVLYAVSEDTGYKVSNVTVYSEVEVISHNSTVENTLSVSKTTLTYDENKTTITDAYDNQEIYIFDTNPDCLKEFYTVIDGKVAAAERYTYSDYDYDLDFSIVESANENLLNCFDYTQFVSLADDSTNAPFDKFARVDYDKYRRAIREETTWKHSVISAAKPCVITHHTYDDAHHLIKSVSEVYHLAKNPPTYTTVTTYQYNDKGSVIRSESYVDGRQLTEGITIEEHEYDDKGREVRTFSYNTLDASSKFYTEREYDEDGKLVSEPDATGKHKTSYRYAAGDGKLLGEILPNGSEFAYGYDEAGRVTAITHSTEVLTIPPTPTAVLLRLRVATMWYAIPTTENAESRQSI